MGVGGGQSKEPPCPLRAAPSLSEGPKCTAQMGVSQLSWSMVLRPGGQVYNYMDGESKAQKNEDFFMFHSKKTAWVRVAHKEVSP